MAAIDKIYGNCDKWVELYNWLKQNKPQYIKYLYDCPPHHTNVKEFPICNFPKRVDKWLLENCPIKFVIKRIKEQYDQEANFNG